MERGNSWIEVRDGGTNRLLFLYDPWRRLVSVKGKGMRAAVLVDLVFYDRLLGVGEVGAAVDGSERALECPERP